MSQRSGAAGLGGLIGASVLISAYIHGELYAEGMAQTPVIGPLFALNAAGGLVIGLAVLFWRHWLPMLGALGFGVLTLGGYVMAVTVGLFGLKEQVAGLPALAAAITELIAIVGAVVWLATAARGRARTGGARAPRRSSHAPV